MSEPLYVLGRIAEETERLQTQATFLQPFTERLFRDAGIGRGIKVLDLGSGAGDVALLAARLVGSEGEVVGIDTNSAILETARGRARDAGCSNVSFAAGDIRELSLPQDFDAVVGRYVLMFMSDPAAAIRSVVGNPGGGQPRYARQEKPRYRQHKAERPWPLTLPSPKPQIDRQLIKRMREQAKRAIDAHRPQIEALMRARA
jgi:ubiquinone/menaquinone biosynthesis C-methylase UbiE